MKLRHNSIFTRLLTVLLSTLVPTLRSEAQSSGKVGAVNQDASGTPPGSATHTLLIGAGVVYRESIKTSLRGSTQILFPDQSTLNIGRNSTLVIDEYVYDPKTGTGSMLASLSKGALRFVGGRISHTAGVTLNTPIASLGIRGGVASIVFPITPAIAASDPILAGLTGELVIGHVGRLTLKNRVSEVIIRPGFATVVSGPDVPIPEPFRVSDLVLARVVSALTSGRGQSGGAKTVPAEPFIVRDGVGTVVLGDPAHPPGTDPLGYTSIFGFGSDVARSKAQGTQTQNISRSPGGDPLGLTSIFGGGNNAVRRVTVTPPPYGAQ